jgi:hypothetical protein
VVEDFREEGVDGQVQRTIVARATGFPNSCNVD